MKKPIITGIALAVLMSLSYVQAQNVVFETIYLKPKTENLGELREVLLDHNRKFHAEAPYTADSWRVITGKNSGNVLWVMGPFTFSDLDGRPGEGGHDEDWMGKVLPHTYGMKDGNYWTALTDYGYSPTEDYQGKLMRARLIDVKHGKWDEFLHLMMSINKVYAENSFGHSFALFSNWSNDGDSDYAIVWQYDNYAYFDEDLEFWKKYEEVHGDNSWHQFVDAIGEVVESARDELYERLE